MTPTLPFWFKQRQCQAEPVDGESMLRISGPNLGEAFVRIDRADNGQWSAALRLAADGEDVARTDPEIPNDREAWRAAFELYRTHVIV